MKRTPSFLIALILSAGLVAASLTSASAAPTKAASTIATEVTVFKFGSGKFTGKVEADRRLCLQTETRKPRSVTIYKKIDGELVKQLVAPLNMSEWATLNAARFSVRHPAMDITKRWKRSKALKGNYVVKLEALTKMEYSKTFSCSAASKTLSITL